jgi:hypothetical protein
VQCCVVLENRAISHKEIKEDEKQGGIARGKENQGMKKEMVKRNIHCYTTWLPAGQPGFDSRQRQRVFYPIHSVQTGSGAHSDSYLNVTGGFVPGSKAAGA